MHIHLRRSDGARYALEHPSSYRLNPEPERLTVRAYASVGDGALTRGLWLLGHHLPGPDGVLIGQQAPPQGRA